MFCRKPKTEVRNPNLERISEGRKPEGTAGRNQSRTFFHAGHRCGFALRISGFFRASAIRVSEFRLNADRPFVLARRGPASAEMPGSPVGGPDPLV